MIKIKQGAFTLSEVLITLAIVGILAMIVLPGLIKDSNNRAMMSNLQSTIANVTNAVQNEIVRTGAKDLADTNLYKDPEEFLKTLDPVKTEGNAPLIYYPDGGYKAVSGTYQTGIAGGNYNASAILKNGVALAIVTRTANGKKYTGAKDVVMISMDLNGKNDPNIIGVDMFEMELARLSDTDNGIHMGDPVEYSDNKATTRTDCLNGTPLACYDLVVLSGFNPNYLEEE